jgi:hypothetical protein
MKHFKGGVRYNIFGTSGMYVCMHACMYVYMYVCVYVCVTVQWIALDSVIPSCRQQKRVVGTQKLIFLPKCFFFPDYYALCVLCIRK